MIEALLWVVDGTLAESERDGHRVAFNLAFEACGLAWHWDETRYGELLRITGGRERLMHDMNSRSDAPVLADQREALARAVHARKNVVYANLVREGRIALRDGVMELMQQCRQRGLRMGIATTTSRSSVQVLLEMNLGANWSSWFASIVCGEDVRSKKPDPEVYFRALRELGIGPLQAVALEDSPGGVAAARAADIAVVVTRSFYFANAPIDGTVAIGPGLHTREGWRPSLRAGARGNVALPLPSIPSGDGRIRPALAPLSDGARVGLDDILAWCAQMDTVSDFP